MKWSLFAFAAFAATASLAQDSSSAFGYDDETSEPTTTTPTAPPTTKPPQKPLPTPCDVDNHTLMPLTTTTMSPLTTTTTTTTVEPRNKDVSTSTLVPSTPRPTPAATKPSSVGTPAPTTNEPDDEENFEPTPKPTTPLTTVASKTGAPTTTGATAAPVPTPAATKPKAVLTPAPTTDEPDFDEPITDCGNLVPCTMADGRIVECQNPNHRQCCHGVPYDTWVHVVPSQGAVTQSCCTDASGNPLVVVGTACPTTSTIAPAPTPAATKPKVVTTPAPTDNDEEDDETPETRCTAADFDASHQAAIMSSSTDKCAVDIGVKSGEFKSGDFKPTTKQALKLGNSINCKAYYKDVQVAAAHQKCLDLDLVANNISFDMAATSMLIQSYPKTKSTCGMWFRTKTKAKLLLKGRFKKCLGATTFYDHFFDWSKLPTLGQLEAIKQNAECRRLLDYLQQLIQGESSCSIDGTDGTDIKAFEDISFDGAVDLLLLQATLAQDVAKTVKLSATFEGHSSSSSMVLGVLVAGAMVALVAVVVLKTRGARHPKIEERKRLLQV
ncbi:Aste57867_23776 [Aphanomyces stellatus]|uniref:Aste57867_23776 protein n=1 Tax=Aphanomyces stellatus TaxID=120398 RepID=A0A485LNK0_9STRA|nr:hypothetical protein As57867_023703 [Aphanomyces stellatus]VFU00421.1 Aste57867_23776 [Aphanomyces stellatus]